MKLLKKTKASLTSTQSRLAFKNKGGGVLAERFLVLDGEPLYNLGNTCGTCHFFFRRLRPAASVTADAVVASLNAGLSTLAKDLISQFAAILPAGSYLPCLFEVTPKLVGAGHSESYFITELPLAWNTEGQFDSDYSDPFYQGDFRQLSTATKLFEFVIPTYPLEVLSKTRVEHYGAALDRGDRPTVVSVGILDIKESAEWPERDGIEIEPAHPVHWCFAHYVLDGNHKLYAAAKRSRPITLLSFLAPEHSWDGLEKLLKKY